VFGRFIPDFGRVNAQMQFDMYHHYTVDEHTIRAIGLLAKIEKGDLAEDHPLATAIIGISSISMLRTFIEAGTMDMPGSHVTAQGVMWQTIIHTVFIVSAIGIAYIDKISQPPAHH